MDLLDNDERLLLERRMNNFRIDIHAREMEYEREEIKVKKWYVKLCLLCCPFRTCK